MARKFIIANWKMNGTHATALAFARDFTVTNKKVRAVVAAPYTMLAALSVADREFELAAQNVSEYEDGAYTGEISATMLKDVGVRYGIVGHSERRAYFDETDKRVHDKIVRLQAKKITPVVCVGETADQRRKGETNRVLTSQVQAALRGITRPVIIAYEPVWAISTFQKGKQPQAAQPADIARAHAHIKRVAGTVLGVAATRVPVLYGGSVTPDNADLILNLDDVDGALVGGASLKASSLMQIIHKVY